MNVIIFHCKEKDTGRTFLLRLKNAEFLPANKNFIDLPNQCVSLIGNIAKLIRFS